MKKLFAMLLVVVMVFGMIPVYAGAATATATPSIDQFSLTLNGILGVNCMVSANGVSMDDVMLRLTIGDDISVQEITEYTRRGDYYVFTAGLPSHRVRENLKIELLSGNTVVQTKLDWTVAGYLDAVKNADPTNTALVRLCDALWNYCAYAAWNAHNAEGMDVETVEAITADDIGAIYESTITSTESVFYGASLIFNDAIDIRYYFVGSKMGDYTVAINGTNVDPTGTKEGLVYYEMKALMPQQYDDGNTVTVSDGNNQVFELKNYGVYTYLYRMLSKGTSEDKYLGLLKAMYLYSVAAEQYIATDGSPIELVDQLLQADSWSNGATVSDSVFTVPANSSLKADYMKALWDEGYTHLVFTVNAEAASDNNTNYTNGGEWSRYWANFDAAADVDIRIDLNEFHDGDTWYSLNFNAGNMTISNPRAYKSAETLSWTKSSTNCYFAIEDGYYVLETRGNDFGVTSPASWIQKYMVSDDAGQRTWLMYTDYISQKSNTRSMLWGWGSPVNTIIGDVSGGWSWNNNVSADHNAFSLHMDKAGTARFKLLDWVSNRNSWNNDLAISYVDAQTIRWSAASDYKLRLATTQDLIAAGYTTLKVTLTGDLGNAEIWYGDDDWSNGEICVGAEDFADGTCTFTVDLTTFTADKNFTMMANASSFTDLLVKIEAKILTLEQIVLDTNSWTAASSVNENGSLTTGANSQLTGSAFKKLWSMGYTHLVFTVNAQAAADNNTNYTHGGSWSQYWANFDAAADVDIRVDLNEFHDGDTWYSLNFNAGTMTVSNPRAYKSAETLNWTKSSSNIYFALEDGYYVLETRGNDFGVTSPASWIQKYMVSDDAGQRTWLMYTDYISQKSNTRSMLWGWGSPVNTIIGDVSGGWSWNNNVSADHNAFSLHMDKAGTARFKLLDWVSNRNEWNSSLAISYVDAQTIRWSAASDYKLRLATTQDLIAQGYTTLKVTLTGNLGSAQIWYGEDDWSDGEVCVSADSFSDGSCTFEVDLTTFNADETFTMMANAASFTDLLVKIEPIKPVYYSVTVPSGEGYTFSGADTALEGTNYSFTVMPNDGIAVSVKVNGQEIIGENGTYTVENVTCDLLITVETKVMTAVDKLLTADNWSAGGTVGGNTLTVPANSGLKADYLKALWEEGYTHLVFTVNAQAASDNNTNYTHGGEWSRYWANFDAATNVDIRIDLNEFYDGDTWYNVNFNAGTMAVSNPRAYKSAETLNWTKSSTNCYFAIEDGYYVLETRGNDFGVTSPASWIQKYMVSDDAGQRTWLMYTDYISQRNNTRSMLWGWGSAVNTVCGDVNGGWAWNNNVSADHNAFSLHMDKAGTARFKLLDWVSNRNSWNNDLAISYVDAQTIRWSAASDYKLRLATTQDLIAAGYTHLNVTLTGDLGSAQIWYGEDDWSDGEICVSADSFVDGACTFEVDLTAFNADETFTMMANAASFADLLIKIEPVQKEIPKKVFSVTAPSGNDFIFEGAATVEEDCDYSFTVIPFADSTTLTVSVNGVVLAPVSENTYLVENVSENLTISVEAQLFAPENVVLNTSNWTSASSVNENGSLTTGANSQLIGSAMKQLWEEGYTHLVFTVNAEAASDNNTNYTHGGSWSQYWANFDAATNVDIRIDLNEFHNGDTWYNVNFNAGNMTVSNPRAYKSAETLKWTKSSTNCYFAIEDGYYVLETRGNDFGVTSPASWIQKYMVSDDAGQRTWLMYTDYISQRDNTRSMLWGWGSAVNTVCGDVNGGWAWNNNVSADHNAFSLHMDKSGTARFKLLDWVSNRNEWNSSLAISYVDAQTIRWSAASDYKLRLATTQDLIAAGYTTLQVTLTGDLGSALIWYGDDDWSNGEIAVDAAKFADGSYTFQVDLTTFAADKNFTMMANAASFTDLLVKIEPIGKAQQYAVKLMNSDVCNLNGNSYATAGQAYSFSLTTDANVTLETVSVNGVAYTAVEGIYTVPVEAVTGNLVIRVESFVISNAIIAANDSYTETAKLLESELEAVSGNYGVYTLSDNVSYRSSILLGTNTIDANVTAETYYVSGDGTNIYIDGNCSRAVAYGAADFLRSLGYEFYTADVTTRPASISLNFDMAELTDTADFAVRSYLSAQTGYNENSLKNQAFTVLSKNNNALFANYDNFGGGVEIEDFNGGVHNFNAFFVDQTEGKYGYTVSTGVGSETGFAPCLTNGVTYNVGGTDTTLTYAVARMKEAMLANPDAYYFSFCQNDGSTWYCGCEHCTADAASHNRSGTLVNFINAMIAQLEADADLSGRDFRIITFAYSFTAQAPANVSALSDKLQVWYAQWHNANYSINSDSQDLNNYTANLRTWADLTADGNLSLWLYDAHFNNYLAYFPSVNTIAANIAEAKALGVSNILVQGSWNAENMWQAEMKAYIWSKLLWDSSLDVETLQQNFLKAYFGDAAYSSVKTFVDLYDNGVGGSANVRAGYPISNGYGYFCHMDVYKQSTVHSKALDAANAAIAAIAADSSLSNAQKAVCTQRANALLATVYGSVIGNWSGYEKWHDQWFSSDNFDDFETYFGASAADCQAMLATALESAGITKASESNMSVSEWIAYMTNLYNTAG